MFIYGTLQELGKIDVSALKNLIGDVDEKHWAWDQRPMFSPFVWASAPSLWFVVSPFTEDYIFHTMNRYESFSEFPELVDTMKNIHENIEKKFDCKIVTSSIIRLKPNANVGEHTDGYENKFRFSHRLIIPVAVNEECYWVSYIDNERKLITLEENTIYDSNPFIPHGTINKGKTIRYHLVMDIVCKEDKKAFDAVVFHNYVENLKEFYKNQGWPRMTGRYPQGKWQDLLVAEQAKYEDYIAKGREW
jgi:hypothetical protein